jgi:hypothetical protein
MNPGIYDISNEEYHGSEGISRSGVMEILETPRHYWDSYLNPNKPEKKETPAMSLGSAVHCYLLEPDVFEKEYVAVRNFDARTKEGKAYRDSLEEYTQQGKKLLKYDVYHAVVTIAEEIKLHPIASGWMHKDCKIEKSIYWIDPETQVLCKARPDIWLPNALIDLKTARSVKAHKFKRAVEDGGLHIQAAMQIEAVYRATGVYIENFANIACLNKRPYLPKIFGFDEATIELGRKEFKKALRIYADCLSSDKWPGYSNDIEIISLVNKTGIELSDRARESI